MGSDGRMFNQTDFDRESFFKSVIYTVQHPCSNVTTTSTTTITTTTKTTTTTTTTSPPTTTSSAPSNNKKCGAVTYKEVGPLESCAPGGKINTEQECREAATILGLSPIVSMFASSWPTIQSG